jgi:hypothetical protein
VDAVGETKAMSDPNLHATLQELLRRYPSREVIESLASALQTDLEMTPGMPSHQVKRKATIEGLRQVAQIEER